MEHESASPLAHPEVRLANGPAYLAAFVLEAAGVFGGVWVLRAHLLGGLALTILLPVIGLIVLVAQSYLFFELNFSQGRAWYMASLLLTLPLVVITIAMTVLMFITLMHRTLLGV